MSSATSRPDLWSKRTWLLLDLVRENPGITVGAVVKLLLYKGGNPAGIDTLTSAGLIRQEQVGDYGSNYVIHLYPQANP